MIARTTRKLALALAALALSAAALAPAASADYPPFSFEPGAFAKAHAPLNHPPPSTCVGLFQCTFTGAQVSDWVQVVKDAPELTQAGAHPDFSVHFRFAQTGPTNNYLQGGHVRTIITDAPAGSIGNPLAVPRCEASQLHLAIYGACPPASQVGGAVTVSSFGAVGDTSFYSPVSSMVPAQGQPGLLAFKSFAFTALLNPEVRSDGDYGLRIIADDIPIPLTDYIGNTLTLWGVPHDPVHDPLRFNDIGNLGGHVTGTPVPFLTAPTNCSSGPLDFTLMATPWEHPGLWAQTTSTAPEPSGCDQVKFEPSLSAQPTTDVADQPSGLEVDVHTPQNNDACKQIKPFPSLSKPQFDCGLATSHLKDTTVKLPPGLVINPSGANGLDGCSPAQIGLTTPLGVSPQQFTKDQPTCPDASKIGRVEVDTPLLDAPMPGTVYIADPYDNPFKSLTAIYIVANDKERGIIAKLAGRVDRDPVTGQLTTTVTNAPQLPFEHFYLHIQQGPYAPLRTPGCGDYSTAGELTPYSDPGSPVPTSESFSIAQGPQGSCDQPNAPAFDAGPISPVAKSFSPFVMHLRRDDATQNFKAVTISPPQGTIAKLAGVAQCSDADLGAAAGKSGAAEKASPSCPANSEVGKVVAGAGAGPSPYYAPGKVYMAGPYKGAPLSLAIVTPATAGPFDLGTIVVRTALHIDSKTAQITAVSDPIPAILDGIPTDVRSVDLTLDRDQFTQTGTSCDPSAVTGQLTSLIGQVAQLSVRNQLAECTSLGFKPQMSLFLKGATKRTGHPRLTVVLKTRPGDANISALQLSLPRSEFLDQAHIRTICTRVQFAADACPKGATYGRAWVTTPILDYTLTGNVLLRSSDNTLPDLVPDLRGPAYQPIRIESAGRTDSIKGGIRNTFSFIPDAPFTKLVTRLQAGKKGLLINSRNICARTYRATVRYRAHNGRTFTAHPKVHAGCKRKKHRKHRKHKHHRRGHRSSVAKGSAVR